MIPNPQNGSGRKPVQPHRVLLTFDDGPHAAHSLAVLDELSRHGLKAVFFVQGQKLANPENRAVVERASADGHLIGNHTCSHPRLTQLTDSQIRDELRGAAELIGDLDRGVKLWRPPYGDRDGRVDRVAEALGYTRMLWNIDSLDWRGDRSADQSVDRLLAQIQSRWTRGFRNSVCLFHDALPATAAILRGLLERLGELPGTRIARYDPTHPDGLCLPGEQSPPGPPACPADACSFPLEDSLVVSRTGMAALYVLNETGKLVWEELAGGASEAEAAHRLAREYAISGELAARDLRAALADWRVRGLWGPKAPELEDPGPWPQNSDPGWVRPGASFAEERCYRFLDVGFRIRYPRADFVAAIHPRFAHLETAEGAATDPVLEAAAGGQGWDSADAVAYRLFFDIVRMAHPDLDPMACLHASLVGNGKGSIALAGNNGSGKSTLAAALTSEGFDVWSDDRLFLDSATGRPAAAPNAVNLKRGSWAPLLARCPAIAGLPIVRSGAEEFRFLPTTPPLNRSPLPVTCVFFPRYDSAAETAAIAMTAVQAVERMVADGGWISSDPGKLGRFLAWAKELRCYALPYASLDAAISCIRESLGA